MRIEETTTPPICRIYENSQPHLAWKTRPATIPSTLTNLWSVGHLHCIGWHSSASWHGSASSTNTKLFASYWTSPKHLGEDLTSVESFMEWKSLYPIYIYIYPYLAPLCLAKENHLQIYHSCFQVGYSNTEMMLHVETMFGQNNLTRWRIHGYQKSFLPNLSLGPCRKKRQKIK